MILFFNKENGEVFAAIAGRVHDERTMAVTVNPGIPDEQIGKFVIGWEETSEEEEVEQQVESFVELKNGLFKKIKQIEKVKRQKNIEHNLDKFGLLQKFESNDPESPMDYRIENNNLIKK